MNVEDSGKPARLLPYLGWLTGALFFFYAWVVRVAPSVMIEELMRDFAVGAAAIGNLSAFYFYGYAGMQVPIGMMMDRFGPRRLMTAAAGVCALGCVLFAVSIAFWVLLRAAFSLERRLRSAWSVPWRWPASGFRPTASRC